MSANDWIGVGIIVGIILLGLFGIGRLSKPYDLTIEEFERRAKDEPGLLNAGMIGIQKILDPATEKAVAAQQDFRQGRYNEEEGAGDPPEPGTEAREENKVS